MEKEKLILSQNGNRFYLSVPEKIKIGRCQSHCDDMDEDIVIGVKYINFFRDLNISYSSNEKNLGLMSNYNSICLMYNDFHSIIIPKGTFELNRDIFNKLKEILKKYDNIFELEIKEFYSDENYKVNIDYEMIKLENPIKNKNYLFRLKENNIPKEWVEQANSLIKLRESMSSSYGNISNGKITLIDFFGCIPNNLDFIISEEYAKRLDRLFICWNNGNKKTKQMEFIDFLYDNFYNKLKINNNNCIINIRDKILLLVDIQNIQIIEFRFNYYNIDISHYNSLKEVIDKIQNKINELNVK